MNEFFSMFISFFLSLFLSTFHPMLAMMTLIIISMMVSVLLKLNSSSLMSFILFLILVSGLLIVFTYISSISSPEKMKLNFFLIAIIWFTSSIKTYSELMDLLQGFNMNFIISNSSIFLMVILSLTLIIYLILLIYILITFTGPLMIK